MRNATCEKRKAYFQSGSHEKNFRIFLYRLLAAIFFFEYTQGIRLLVKLRIKLIFCFHYTPVKLLIERKELPGANYWKNNMEVMFIGLTL